jgi:glycosyltransferase involved in cell wall biosynthesis
MHIGFDISQTGAQKAGCGYFAYALINAMTEIAPQHQYLLFPSFGDFFFDPTMPIFNPYPGKSVSYGPRHLSREAARLFWTRQDLESALAWPDIIHSNNFWAPIHLSSSRLIYTLYDLGFTANPAWTSEANRTGCFEGVFRASVVADWIIAISRSSRDHYLKVFPHFPAERIRVVYPCSRFTDSTAEGKKPACLKNLAGQEFWLSVGTIEPRKNQRLLIQAFARYLQAGGRPMPLVLAGGKGWLMEDFEDHITKLGIREHVILTGYVSDDEMIWLFRNCFANLYPSLFEGFGLPIMEGMQFGAPTLSSDSTSMPEAGGDAAILISPLDAEAWAQNMLMLSTDIGKRNMLAESALRQAARFRWKDSAAAVLAVYEEAIRSPKRRNFGEVAAPELEPAVN